MEILFPFSAVWWVYAAFIGLVVGVLAIDLGVVQRRAHAVSLREAATWSAVWIALAGLANLAFWWWARHDLAGRGLDPALGDRVALEFLAGYVVEKALAVDNIFVIAMAFGALSIPAQYRHRVLFYGILGALVFRAAFIALGAQLLQHQWIVWVAGGFLVVTGVKMLLLRDGPPDPARNPVLRLLRRVLPVTEDLHGQRFLVQHRGALAATPLLVALIAIETADIVFAIDSVPAIFALTDEPLVVFCSNILAILGLRSLYFLLEGVMERFHLLKYSLALILVFVGLKMAWLNDALGGKFPIGWSLAIIGALLAAGVVGSLLSGRRSPAEIRPRGCQGSSDGAEAPGADR